jgi:hypothetical protein
MPRSLRILPFFLTRSVSFSASLLVTSPQSYPHAYVTRYTSYTHADAELMRSLSPATPWNTDMEYRS